MLGETRHSVAGDKIACTLYTKLVVDYNVYEAVGCEADRTLVSQSFNRHVFYQWSTRSDIRLLKHHFVFSVITYDNIVVPHWFCLSVPNGKGLDLRTVNVLAGLYSKWLNCYLDSQTGNRVSAMACRFKSCLRRLIMNSHI